MSLYRLLLRSLRRSATLQDAYHYHPLTYTTTTTTHTHTQTRSFAFSSAEEAAAVRRRRKRRMRIEPPLNAIRPPPHQALSRDPNATRQPESTSALTGRRLTLHNRVQSLIRAGDLDAASAVARHSVFSVTRPTVFTCNALMGAMIRAKRYNEAVALFHFFFNQSNIIPNIVSYNNLINAHCDDGRVDVALEVYRHLLSDADSPKPSPFSYRHLTKGLVDAGRVPEALDLLRKMVTNEHGADSLVYNNVITGFLGLGNLDKANELFDDLKERCLVYDGVVNATFMEWFFKQGRDREAVESYKSLLDRQFSMIPATGNVLLEVLLKHGRTSEAWALFDRMLDNHTPPGFQAVNSDTFSIMVNECFKLGKFAEALATFKKAGTKPNSKPFAMDVAGYNNIIARFCENGMLSEAETLFEELCSRSLSPDVPTHRTLIDAYLRMERIDDALRVFRRMVDAGLRVVATFGNRVFDELIKNGKAIDCAKILSKMGEPDPKPDPTCYEVVIKGLCGEGLLDKSLELLDEVMRYGVGVTSTLRESVMEVFKKAGRGEEIERLLNTNGFGYSPRPSTPAPRPPYRPPPRSPPQMAEALSPPSGPPPRMAAQQRRLLPSAQMAGTHNPPTGSPAQQQHPPQPSQLTGMHQSSWGVPPQVAGTHMPAAGASPHTSGQHFHSPSERPPHMTRTHQPPFGVAPQTTLQRYTPSGPSPQMAGHQPYGTPPGRHQMAGQRYPPSGLIPPTAGQYHPLSGPTPQISGSAPTSYGAPTQMSPPYSVVPGQYSQTSESYHPPSGTPSHIEESHQQQSEVPEQVAA